MPKTPTVISLATLLAATIALAGSLAHAAGSSATGHAVVNAGDDVLRILSFSATGLGQGDAGATGYIEFHDPKPMEDQDVDGSGDPALASLPEGVRLTASIDCLAVDGDQAIIGGQVTSATASRYVGMWVLLFVETGDGTRTSPMLSWGFYPYEAETGCGSFPFAAYEPLPIESGHLSVQQ
jgi:hypothetical protein